MDMSHPPLQDYHSSVQLEPKDDEFHSGPDQAARDRAIAAFLERLEVQEQHSYTGLGDVLSRLPLPTTVDQPWLSVHDAMEAGMLPLMDDEESRCFTAMVWLALGNRLSVGLRWQVKNSWGHDHDLPSPATHYHSRPATCPENHSLVQIHLQLVAKLWVLAIFVGHIKSGIRTPTAWTLPDGRWNTYKPSRPLHSPFIMNPDSPNLDTLISGISVR
jgi:hypothetical protein